MTLIFGRSSFWYIKTCQTIQTSTTSLASSNFPCWAIFTLCRAIVHSKHASNAQNRFQPLNPMGLVYSIFFYTVRNRVQNRTNHLNSMAPTHSICLKKQAHQLLQLFKLFASIFTKLFALISTRGMWIWLPQLKKL